MNTRLLLVNPPYDIQRYMGGLGRIGWVFPPVGLLYLAAHFRAQEPDSQVQVYDYQVDGRDFWGLMESNRPDVVGITCQTALVYSTLRMAADIRARYPNTRIVVGGVHASIRPQDLLASGDVDAVVRGQGEHTLVELCRTLTGGGPLDAVAGISFKDTGGRLVHAADRPLESNLGVFARPAMDLVPIERYRISPDLRTGSRLGLILTARGCPHNCLFCANKLLTERRYFKRPVEDVLDEIDHYLERYRINQLLIMDDNFAVDRKRTLRLCDEFIARGYPKKFNWWAEARVDCLDEKLLSRMKQAGCSILSFGLESGNQRLLDLIDKRITLEQTERAVKLVKKVGIKSRASIILGLPTETRAESLRSIRFAYRLPLDQVRFSIATPFPGTKLWDIAVAEGKVDPDNIDWTRLSLMSGYTDHDPLYWPDGRSPQELKRLQRRANFLFFVRPRIVLGYLGRIRRPSDILHLANGFVQFAKSSLGLTGARPEASATGTEEPTRRCLFGRTAFGRYCMVAAMMFSINIGLTAVFHELLRLPEAASLPLANLVVFVLGFLSLRHYTFGSSEGGARRQLGRYAASHIGFRAAEYAAFLVAHLWLGTYYLLAVAAITGTSFLVKFFFYRAHVFVSQDRLTHLSPAA